MTESRSHSDLACAYGARHRRAAHPHVWVAFKSEVVYAPDGSVTGIRHAWSFDDMFSTFATQGIEAKEKGKFTREELAPLAEVNVSSLKEFEFFTYVTADGKKQELADPSQASTGSTSRTRCSRSTSPCR